MYVILDNLTGIIVGTIILLLLATLQLRNQDENLDAIRGETNRARMIDMVHVVERDLRNAGSGTDGAAVVSWSNALPTPGSPVTALEFYTTVDTSATALPNRLRYDLAVSDSVQVQGQWLPLYKLDRLEFNGSDWVPVGSSASTIEEFELTLLDESADPTSDPAQTRAFAIRATTISAFGADSVTRDSRWESTIWPINLRL